MMHWITPMMWSFCRIIGNTLTFIGLAGLLLFTGKALAWTCKRLNAEEDIPHEDQD